MTKNLLNHVPRDAFLLIEGRIFHLDKPVINIGRSLESELVLEDTSVSRSHAKLVAKRGRFILVDQNSTYGTYVNGERVQKKTLQSGDIISLASFMMLYVEGSTLQARSNWERTRPLKVE